MRNYLQYVIAALGLTTAIAASIFIGQIDEKTNFPTPITVDGKTIEFTWTDDNTNENLIIYTDKATYSNGLSHAEVYVAVENASDNNQNIELMAYFRDDKKRIKDVSVLTTISERVETPVFESICGDAVEKATTTRREVSVGTATLCSDVQTSTSTSVVEKNVWVPLATLERNSVEITKESLALKTFARKPVESFAASRKTNSHYVPIGSVVYYKVLIEFPVSTNDNFYFEAIGDRDGYGHLDPWFDTDWDYRVSITIDDSKVPTTQTSFPVYVDLSDLPADFHTNVKTDGCDIRVVESDETTETAFELVDYDSATDTGELHFMADSLTGSGGGDTTFYIYYGNSAASCYAVTDTYGRNAVWTDYVMVTHMYDLTTGTVQDSTGNYTLNKASAGNPNEVDSVFHKGQAYQANGDHIIPSSIFNLSTVTYQAWAKIDAWNPNGVHYYLGKRSGPTNGNVELQNVDVGGGVHRHSLSLRIAGGWRSATCPLTDTALDTAYHVVGTYDGSTIYCYENGVQGVGTSYSGSIPNMNVSTWIGGHVGFPSLYYLQGEIAEARVRSGALSANWITTEYNNQSDPGTFYTVGTQESNTPASTGAKQDVFWF